MGLDIGVCKVCPAVVPTLTTSGSPQSRSRCSTLTWQRADSSSPVMLLTLETAQGLSDVNEAPVFNVWKRLLPLCKHGCQACKTPPKLKFPTQPALPTPCQSVNRPPVYLEYSTPSTVILKTHVLNLLTQNTGGFGKHNAVVCMYLD